MKQIVFSTCDNDITNTHRTSINHLPCASCGSTVRKLGAGKVPGEASLLCECGKFVKWLSGSELIKLNQGVQI